jgi:hypothetical protein
MDSIRAGSRGFLFFETSRPEPGSTQPPTQRTHRSIEPNTMFKFVHLLIYTSFTSRVSDRLLRSIPGTASVS